MRFPEIRQVRAFVVRGGGADYHDQGDGHWIADHIATPMARYPDYRQSRRSFIAASEAAGGDVISRVHPAKTTDGKPLFCDSVALGPRDGVRALLLIDGDDGAVTGLLPRIAELPKGARLVAVHALDPYTHAWCRPGEPGTGPIRHWPQSLPKTCRG